MEENPAVEKALAKIMALLDQEIPKSLVGFRLYNEATFEAEALLVKPAPIDLQRQLQETRENARKALQEWLCAEEERMHNSSES